MTFNKALHLRMIDMGSIVRMPQGILFPNLNLNMAAGEGPSAVGATAMAATTNKIAMIGHLYIDGRAASKTLNTSGSSSIAFRTGATTWAATGTPSTIDIGIQGVSSSGPQAQPDGTFTVKATVTSPTGLTTNAWNTIIPTTGTATLNHGDLVAVVFDLTNRAGSDSVIINCGAGFSNMWPIVNEFFSGAWAASGKSTFPNVMITFSDGTKGTIDWTIPFLSLTTDTAYKATSNPEEQGSAFQLPWDCDVDGLFANLTFVDAASDYTIKLWSDPLGTPSALASIAVLAEQVGGSSSQRFRLHSLATPVSLTRNTTYGVTMLATGTSNIQSDQMQWSAAGDRVFAPGGTTLQKIYRHGGSGVFTADTTKAYFCGVRICGFVDRVG